MNQSMQNLFLEATDVTPMVKFETNGQMSLKGRSLIYDVNLFYQPLIDWINRVNPPIVSIQIDIDYLNSASSKKILDLLKNMDANANIKEFNVYWRFEIDDEDILEIGQIFEERLKKAKFCFIEYAEM
jgi:hypothetical protein